MGISRVVVLQPERFFTMNGGQTLTQAETEAVEVLPYVSIIPFIRFKNTTTTPPIPGIGSTTFKLGTVGTTFKFLFAAASSYKDESALAGSRWVDSGSSLLLQDSSSVQGKTVGIGSSGSLAALSNPGALILWQISNGDSTGNSINFVFEILLVCRGY